MKKIYHLLTGLALLAGALNGCKSLSSELPNPNVAGEDKPVPPSLLLPGIEYDIYNIGTGGGPFTQVQRWNQFQVSNNLYYGGQNQYNWTNNASMYGTLTNVIKMEQQAARALGTKNNYFAALGKFFRAYIFVWEATRVGDTPASQAGQGLTNLKPAYDTQKQVFARSLALLDTANTLLAAGVPFGTFTTGDIYFNNGAPSPTNWRKVVNSFKLRVLISLSRRTQDNADLNVPQQFAAIVSNPTQYPLLTSNADNWQFNFNSAYNTYPHIPNDGNNQYQNVGKPFLDLTTAAQDPRTFLLTTPAPAQLAAGKSVGDFTAYVGADISQGVDALRLASTGGQLSFTSNLRYYSSVVGPEPFIILGLAEQNFNIAEGINRGWVSAPPQPASAYYLAGINASLSFYGLTQGQQLPVAGPNGLDSKGNPLGVVTVDIARFLANPNVAYRGDNAAGLEQIINQKYVAFHQNSGWEAFYNWRRTGLPRSFVSTGPGINSNNAIPRRWQYPVDEAVYNTQNYQAALQSQFGGQDNLNADTWLTR